MELPEDRTGDVAGEREREHKGAVSLGEKHANKLESSMGLENFETEENFEPEENSIYPGLQQ